MSYTLRGVTYDHGDSAPAVLSDGARDLRWGLLRPWRGHGGKRGPMIFGATLAEADAMPLLRTSRKTRRCLVLADGVLAARGARWATPGHEVAFAGLWAENADDGVASFALLYGDPVDAIADVATSMPIPVERDAWLAGDLVVDASPWRIASRANPSQGSLF